MRILKIGLLIFAFTWTSASILSAQPVIFSVENPQGPGGRVVVQGSNFGDQAEILSWDTFEQGNWGESIIGKQPIIGDPWERYGPQAEYSDVRYSDGGRIGDSRCAEFVRMYPGTLGFGWINHWHLESIYVSYYRQTILRGWYGQETHFRTFLGPDPFGTRLTLDSLEGRTTRILIQGPETPTPFFRYVGEGPDYEGWNRWEVEYSVAPDATLNLEVSVNAERRLSEMNFSVEGLHSPEYLLASSAIFGGPKYPMDDWYGHSLKFDDVYVATSPARIEVGDNPDFFQCMERELIPAEEWTPQRVVFLLPPHVPDHWFVFVVDEDGVPSTGRPMDYEDPVVDVVIDVKPGDCPAHINCKGGNGVVPVAILTTEDFDALTVDHQTVVFGPDEAMEAHVKGPKRTPRNGDGEVHPVAGQVIRHEEDVDGDGDIDLLFHFRFDETGIQCGDTEAFLTGQTFDGQSIIGRDAIRTVPGGEMEPEPDGQIQISPNPFNPSTRISFAVTNPQHVRIGVYDLRGRQVAELANEPYPVGRHALEWQGRDTAGRAVPSGIYFFLLDLGGQVEVRKAMLMK